MANPFARVASTSAVHPFWTLLVIALVAGGAMAGFTQLESARISDLFIPDNLEGLETREQIEEIWGKSETAFFLYIDADPLDPELIRGAWQDSQRLLQLPEVQDVQGLPVLVSDRIGGLDAKSNAEIDKAVASITGQADLSNFVAEDALLLRVQLEPDQDVIALTDALDGIAVTSRTDADVRAAGTPYIERLQSEGAGEDVAILMPISLVVVLGFLALLFRRVQDVVVPIVTALVAIAMAYGTVAWTGQPLAPPSFIVMPLLLGLGVDYMLHIIYVYRDQDPAKDIRERFEITGRKVGAPVFYTAITTLIGFGSFLASSIPQVRVWGLLIGSGALYAFLLGFTLMPALYRLGRRKQKPNRQPLGGILDRMADWIPMHRGKVLLVGVIVTAGLAVAASQVEVSADVAFELDDEEPAVANFNEVEARFGGQVIAQYLLPASAGEQTEALETALHGDAVIGFVDGPYTRLQRAGLPQDDPAVPATEGVATEAWHLVSAGYEIEDRAAALEALQGYERDLAPESRLTGQDVLGQQSENQFVPNIALSTGLALGFVILLLILVFRSFVTAALAFFPLIITVLWQIGIQTIVNIPINPITGVMTAMMIGVGVDYSIHMVSHFREERKSGLDRADASAEAIKSVGKPVLAATLTTIFAFAVLGFSSLLPLRDFGRVAAIVVGCAFVVSLTILPAVLSIGGRRGPPRAIIAGREEEALRREAARQERVLRHSTSRERVAHSGVHVFFEDPEVQAWYDEERARK